MDKSVLHRLVKLETQRILKKPVEIMEVITMQDGRVIVTPDVEEASLLEAQGGKWDLLIRVRE